MSRIEIEPSSDRQTGELKRRVHDLFTRARAAVPFAAGVLAALLAFLLNSALAPAADGTPTNAEVIAEQPENDIAVLSTNQTPAQIVPAPWEIRAPCASVTKRSPSGIPLACTVQ